VIHFIDHMHGALPVPRPVNWRGRSGRGYDLQAEPIDAFALESGTLHLVALGNLVLWVGSADDVIQDAVSRARFRLALDCGDRVFRVHVGPTEGERMTAIWDLEGAEPVPELQAAAA
jgi:hypothetical protein